MDEIVKNMRDLELNESEQKELNKILSDMKTGLVYRSFRTKTTGPIAAKLGYIIDTEYPVYEISFQDARHRNYKNYEKIDTCNSYICVPSDSNQLYFRIDYHNVICLSPESYSEIAKKNSRLFTESEKLEIYHSTTEICRFCVSVSVNIKTKTGK